MRAACLPATTATFKHVAGNRPSLHLLFQGDLQARHVRQDQGPVQARGGTCKHVVQADAGLQKGAPCPADGGVHHSPHSHAAEAAHNEGGVLQGREAQEVVACAAQQGGRHFIVPVESVNEGLCERAAYSLAWSSHKGIAACVLHTKEPPLQQEMHAVTRLLHGRLSSRSQSST